MLPSVGGYGGTISVPAGSGSVDVAFANHLVVDAQAPTSVVESYFSTTIHTVSQPRYANEYTPVASATIPGSLAPYVAGVVLDNVVNMGPSSEGRAHLVPGE